MEGCSEPQLDAKAKVTNQVSEWPSLAASAGLGWTSGGRLHLVLRPPLAAAGRCHPNRFSVEAGYGCELRQLQIT
ncbi:COMM domain-containing protein 6 isoform X1 [Tursiops truncatus]|uniref:COMM domain-containing protein 6 isoform X1 n=1 Tax=Tursiops truncatus TaxID=9739 RepID=UPI003CCF7475